MIGPATVRVWTICLDDPAWQTWWPVLAPDEDARAARFVRPQLQQRWRSGRAALRRVVASCLGQDPRSMLITYEPGGKPVLSGRELHFNLSHSGEYAVLAVAEHEVGIDIEQGRPGLSVDDLLRAICTPIEWQASVSLPLEQRRERLLQTWCRKEAWSKAVGVGLQQDFRDIAIVDSSPQCARVTWNGRDWWLHDLVVPAPAFGCLCVAQPDVVIERLELLP